MANQHLTSASIALVEILVVGMPVPKGGLRAVSLPGREFTTLVWKGKGLTKWRKDVHVAAEAAMNGRPPVGDCPVHLVTTFRLQPPKRLTRHAPWGRPDLDKLERAILDSLSGVVYVDDGQIVGMRTVKSWADVLSPPGVSIAVDYWPAIS